MSNNPSTPPGQPPRGISLATFFGLAALLLVLALVALGVVLYFSFSKSAKLERDLQREKDRQTQIEAEERRVANDAQLTLGHSKKIEVLAHAADATNVLGQLLATSRQTHTRLAEFKTNAVGQQASLHPTLVQQARVLYEHDAIELPAVSAVVDKLEIVRRLQLQISDAATAPDTNLVSIISDAAQWGNNALTRVTAIAANLTALEREAKAKLPPEGTAAQSRPLQAAIQSELDEEAVRRQQILLQETTAAKDQAADVLAKAEADRIRAEARREAAEIIRQADEAAAAQRRQMELDKAKSAAQDADTGIAARKITDEASRKLLREKAAQPQVRIKLAPFMEPGLWNPSKSGQRNDQIGLDKKPMSYSAIVSMGALAENLKGLEELVDIANYRLNERPDLPGGFRAARWYDKPGMVDEAREMQKLLIELGPTMVEMGLLSP